MENKEVTKQNVCEIIENYLKEQKIRFEISDQDSESCLYKLFISSMSAYIQVEYDLDDETNNDVYMQLFTEPDSSGFSIYESHWDNENELNDSIEGEIDNLLESAKRINQGIAKIEAKINQIKDICQEYELEFCEFITLEYDFDL
jgi:hypothetical protein